MIKKRIGNVEYEFSSVSELIEFERNQQQTPEESTLRKPNRVKNEIKEIIKRAVENSNKNNIHFNITFFDIAKRHPSGEEYQIAWEMGLLPILKRKQKTSENRKYTLSEKRRKELSDRGLFLTKRANALMGQYDYSREKAWEMAATEYKAKKPIGIIKEAHPKAEFTEFPSVYPIAEDSMKILESVIKHTIANKGTIKYHDVNITLQLADNKEWDGREWHEFVVQFMLNSKKIIEYFGVKGKFVHERDRIGHEIIQYEG